MCVLESENLLHIKADNTQTVRDCYVNIGWISKREKMNKQTIKKNHPTINSITMKKEPYKSERLPNFQKKMIK